MHLVPNDQTLFMRAENHGLITGAQHHRIIWAVHTLMADYMLDFHMNVSMRLLACRLAS
jgi:hypothetical protein